MTDDPTAGDWQPSADQPIDPSAVPQQPPSWVPPAYGPPPSLEPPATGRARPPSAHRLPPYGQADPWLRPDALYPSGAGNVDHIESPPRRRPDALAVTVAVVAVVATLVASGVAIFVSNDHGGKATGTLSAVPSQTASPSPGNAPGGTPSPQASPDGPSGSRGSTPALSGPLDGYLLAPGDLGSRTVMALIPNGRSVTEQATLDFCNFDYTSEKLRASRVQVQYVGGTEAASNEVVRYRSAGAASAFAEIQEAVSGCPSTYRESGGVIGHIQQLPGVRHLTAKHLAVTFATTVTDVGGATTQWTTAVYQFDGDYFSGVYVYGADKAQVQEFAATLAASAAKHLAEAAAGKAGTGGGPFVDANPGGQGAQA